MIMDSILSGFILFYLVNEQLHFYFILLLHIAKRKVEPWTEEQSQELYKLVETAKSKSKWTNWKNFAKTHYNDKRSGYQCRIKW